MLKKVDKKYKRNIFFKKATLLAFFSLLFLSTALSAQAQTDLLGTEYATESGLSQSDPRLVAAGVIKVFLGLLGLGALILMLYAGFMWMTSMGNDEKITTAKKTIWAAVIGMGVILSAYAITEFVTRTIFLATSGNPI